MERRYIAPPIPLETHRQALSAFRLNRATIRWPHPARRRRLWRGMRGGAL